MKLSRDKDRESYMESYTLRGELRWYVLEYSEDMIIDDMNKQLKIKCRNRH